MGDGWDNTATFDAETSAWKPDEIAGNGDGWKPDTAGNQAFNGDTGFLDDLAQDNISKHAAGGDGNCRICAADNHFARDCPDKKGNDGACFNCGEHGHNKADCTNERVEREFTGECRSCGEVGHRAAMCPQKGPTICSLCHVEGHIGRECPENRLFTAFVNLGIEDMPAEEAWAKVDLADKEKDLTDIRKFILCYAKALPDLTFCELEAAFRESEMNTHLIGKKQEISDTMTIVNLQGKKDQKFVVSFQFTAKPRRKGFEASWPSTPEENMIRLAEAGLVVDRMVSKCHNCGELGHLSKECTQDKDEPEKMALTCANCKEEGHRARDCTQPRKAGRECKNCGETGHIAKDCPSKVAMVCRNCMEEGHKASECEKERIMRCRNCDAEDHAARDCPQPKDMSRVKCRNCDEMGHESRGCPKPTDWSRVECTSCHEKGHSYKRCPNPDGAKDEGGNGGGDGGDWGAGDTAGAAGDAGSAGGWGAAGNAGSAGGWAAAEPVAAGSSGW